VHPPQADTGAGRESRDLIEEITIEHVGAEQLVGVECEDDSRPGCFPCFPEQQSLPMALVERLGVVAYQPNPLVALGDVDGAISRLLVGDDDFVSPFRRGRQEGVENPRFVLDRGHYDDPWPLALGLHHPRVSLRDHTGFEV
jgi:hypothetical protein